MPGLVMPPAVWGPFLWHTIHIVALGYSKEPTYAEKKAAKEFYEGLVHLIPCPVCRVHYAEHLKTNPVTPALDTREDLFNWTVNVHNSVNKSLGKPELTPLEALQWYQQLGERGRSPLFCKEDQEAIEMKSVLYGAGIATLVGAAFLGGYALYRGTK